MAQTLMTMKRKLLIMAMMCCSTVMFSQIRIDWQQCYGSMKDDEAYSLLKHGEGYYVLGYVEKGYSGMVECEFSGSRHTWLLEIGEEGELIRQRCLDFGGNKLFGDGEEEQYLYIVGKDGVGLSDNNNISIMKVNEEGETVWRRVFGTEEHSFWDAPRFERTFDGGFVCSVSICFSGGDISQYYGFWDVWVVKLDNLGNIEWETTIGTEGEEMGGRVIPLPDGTYCAVGYARNQGENGSVPSCNMSHNYVDGLVVRLSAEGDITDSRCYGGSLHDSFTTAIPLDDGWLFGGSTQSEDGDLGGAGFHYGLSPNGYLTSDIWLMRTDAEGNILWSRCYGGTQYEFVGRIFQNEDGGFTVFGRTDSHDGDAQSALDLYYPYYNDYRKIWVFRIDADGNLLWERVMGSATSSDEYLNDVIKLNDREYVIAGLVYCGYPQSGDVNCSNGVFFNGQDSGENYWVLHITDVFDYDNVEEKQMSNVRVYPNPAATWIAIDYTLPMDYGKATVEIANTLGVKVLQKQLNKHEGQSVLDLRGLANGVYTLTVMCGEYVRTEKLVISR